jgi:hypothetical protein
MTVAVAYSERELAPACLNLRIQSYTVKPLCISARRVISSATQAITPG